MARRFPGSAACRSVFRSGAEAAPAATCFADGLVAAEEWKPAAQAAFILNPQFDSVGQVAIVEP